MLSKHDIYVKASALMLLLRQCLVAGRDRQMHLLASDAVLIFLE